MKNNNDIMAIIPARSGSKGVPDKNIHQLNGIPLMAYSIAAALKSTLIDRVVVSTDSEDYAKVALSYGAEVPYLRPAEISGDMSSDIQFLKHAIQMLKKIDSEVPAYFVHLRPTTPLRNPLVIDDAIRGFINSNYSALRSVHKMSESAYKNFEIDKGILRMLNGDSNIETANMARQNFPQTFNANGYVDIVRTALIEKEGLMHGNHVQPFVTDIGYEIDDFDDLMYLEYIVEKKSELFHHLFDVKNSFNTDL